MADCSCVHTTTSGTFTTTTDNVTFDGVATCTGFNAGDMNDFITHISDLVCAVQAAVAGISLDVDDIGLHGVRGTCVPIGAYTNLAEWLVDVEAYLCAVNTALTNITVSDIGGTFNCACIGGTAADDLETTVTQLIAYVCSISHAVIQNELATGGDLALPLLPFVQSTLSLIDVSALGVAKIRIGANTYWINAKPLSKIQTDVTLIDSQDNYIFIDMGTDAYTNSPVAIGGATPTTNGDIVCMVRTGVGTVTSSTVLISYSPIDSTLLLDNSIDASKLTTTIGTQPIENDGTNIKLNYDTDHLDVVANELTLAAGAIDNVNLIDAAAILSPSVGVSGGKIVAGVEDSIELDAVSGKVQLVNDSALPGNHMRYGTDSTGTKGWIESGEWQVAEVDLDSADVLALNSSPFTLVTCPAGTVIYDMAICVHKVVFRIGVTGFAYTSANPIEIRYKDGTGDKVTADIPATMITTSAKSIYVANGIDLELTSNEDIVAVVPGADPTIGTRGVTIRVYYTVEQVGNIS